MAIRMVWQVTSWIAFLGGASPAYTARLFGSSSPQTVVTMESEHSKGEHHRVKQAPTASLNGP